MKKTEKYLYKPSVNKENDFAMWMAFPGIYSFSMSSLGYLWMFKTIDLAEDVNIERICSDTKTTKFPASEVKMFGFSFLGVVCLKSFPILLSFGGRGL